MAGRALGLHLRGPQRWGQRDSSSQKALGCPGRGPLAVLALCCLLPARPCPVGSWKSRGAPKAALPPRQGELER